jgi:hypothetical protein
MRRTSRDSASLRCILLSPFDPGFSASIKTLARKTLNHTEARPARSVVLAPTYLRTVFLIPLVALLRLNAVHVGPLLPWMWVVDAYRPASRRFVSDQAA